MEEWMSVALDGPAGAGKSTIARSAARRLHFVYVDTGAIYRTIALGVLEAQIDPEKNPEQVADLLPRLNLHMEWEDGVQHMFLDGEDVSGRIREPAVSAAASRVSALGPVREFLLETQRNVARTHNVIMDGRDIGTVVLPRAQVKIFLSASPEVRARRRWLELQAAGAPDTLDEVLADMRLRDERDTNRPIAPLRPAEDAVRLDTSGMSLEESICAVLDIIGKKMNV